MKPSDLFPSLPVEEFDPNDQGHMAHPYPTAVPVEPEIAPLPEVVDDWREWFPAGWIRLDEDFATPIDKIVKVQVVEDGGGWGWSCRVVLEGTTKNKVWQFDQAKNARAKMIEVLKEIAAIKRYPQHYSQQWSRERSMEDALKAFRGK